MKALQEALDDFDKEFPRFGSDDDYCAPAVYTIGDKPGQAFDGEEIMCGDEAIRSSIKGFIKKLYESN